MLLPEYDLSGKVALVTGAGRDIGQAIALALAQAGADVVAVARTNSEIEATAQQIGELGRRAVPMRIDVTDASQVETMVQQVLVSLGRIDILVNNAGTRIQKPLVPLPGCPVDLTLDFMESDAEKTVATTESEWHGVLDVNLGGAFLCLRAVGPHMIARRQGKVINLSSIVAGRGFPYRTAYSASKGALNSLTRCLAVEWARYNINVNAIAPGFVYTRRTALRYQHQKRREATLNLIPLRRFCQTRDVALLAVYLASAASDYMTGQVLYVDGGLLA